MLIMKIWLEDPKLGCVVGEGFKTIQEYMDVEDNLIEENEELITYILILILRFELDWTWNIKLMLIVVKVKHEEFISYLLILLKTTYCETILMQTSCREVY